MKSMKQVLRLIGALAFTTGVTTTVVACGDPNVPIQKDYATNLDLQVGKDLGLYDSNNKSTAKLEINCSMMIEDIDFKITFTSTLTAVDLLDVNNKAKSQESFNFIIETLGINPEDADEKDFTKTTFARDDLNTITIKSYFIKPELTKLQNDLGLAVTGGGFKIKFMSNNQQIGPSFFSIIESDDQNDIVLPALIFLKNQLNLASINVKTDSKINFRVGEKGPTEQEIADRIFVSIYEYSDFNKILNALNNLLIKFMYKIIVVIGENTLVTGENYTWAVDDVLELKIILYDTKLSITKDYKLS